MNYSLPLCYIVIKVAELNGDGVHRLENVKTMEVGLHILFDYLALWFEATVRYYLIALA